MPLYIYQEALKRIGEQIVETIKHREKNRSNRIESAWGGTHAHLMYQLQTITDFKKQSLKPKTMAQILTAKNS